MGYGRFSESLEMMRSGLSGGIRPPFSRLPVLLRKGVNDMGSWKCSNCGYQMEADAPPDECPSCKEKCEFVDNACYIPDCEAEGIDKRIGPRS